VAGVLVVVFVDFEVVELELEPQPVMTTAAAAQAAMPPRPNLRRIIFLLSKLGINPSRRQDM
jgi:hypothetical protein